MADKSMKVSWDQSGPRLARVVESLTYREVLQHQVLWYSLAGLFAGQAIRPLDWGWALQRSPIPSFLGVGLFMLPGYWRGACDAVQVYNERQTVRSRRRAFTGCESRREGEGEGEVRRAKRPAERGTIFCSEEERMSLL